MKNTFYRVRGNLLEVIGTQGKKAFKIVGISENGIKIEDNADNGVDIVRVVDFSRVKR